MKDNATLDKLSGWAVENFQLPSLSSKLSKLINALDVKVDYEGDKNVYVYSLVSDSRLVVTEEDGNVVIRHRSDESVEPIVLKNSVIDKKVCVYEDPDSPQGNEYMYLIKTTDDSIIKVLEGVNESIADQLQPVKNFLSNVNAKWENVIAKVNPLLKKVSSKIGSANKMLQPTILYLDQNGNPNTLSTIGGRLGTRFVGTGATTLYATSWTAELLAPAYKKSISVLEKGATVTLTNGKSAAEPFAGSVNKVIFNATKAGTYTIVYKAVDYSGIEKEKTFHVIVK